MVGDASRTLEFGLSTLDERLTAVGSLEAVDSFEKVFEVVEAEPVLSALDMFGMSLDERRSAGGGIPMDSEVVKAESNLPALDRLPRRLVYSSLFSMGILAWLFVSSA